MQAVNREGPDPIDVAVVHDDEVLHRQFAVHRDEDRMIQTSKEAAEELAGLFDSDRDNSADGGAENPLDLARSWK